MACVRRAGSARLRHPGSREALSRSGAASQRPHHACAVPLAGIGALIGVTARTPETGGALSLIVTAVLVSLGPVVVPPSRLPALLLTLGWISPATYAASAVRQTLLGPVTGRLALDLAVLLGLSILTLRLVSRRLDGRQR